MAKAVQTTQDPAFLSAALEGLELQRARITEQIDYVKSLLGRKRPTVAASEPAAPAARVSAKRELSEAARKRIAQAQKKRWADYRKAKAAAVKDPE